jgi:transglutaminase-like putative cysteine protease
MRSGLLLAFPLLMASLRAQAPVITPAGDPSVKNDTIYKLAVKPEDYPDQSYVFLLDDGVLRFEADGRGTRTYRQVVQILQQDAVEDWAEQSFSYTSGREKLTINWIRVLKPDGAVISDKPTHEQESLSQVAMEAPVYSDAKVHHVSLGGVAPGTLIDYSYTVERLKPVMPGDFYSGWSVTTSHLVRRSRLIVDVPVSMTPRIQENNLHFPRRVAEAHGRRVYTWATADVPKLEVEPYFAVPNSLFVGIDVSGPIGWADIGHWYADLSRDRYQDTPDLVARLADVERGARSGEDSLHQLYRWVAQDFRYVSLSLGIGGYQPRLPASVLQTKYGDCKDKATLFITLARRMGFKAYPVLLNSDGSADSTLPSVSQFDHMIAAVERPGGYLYLDLTAELTPFGQLPPSEQGGFAVIVHPDGRSENVTLPADSVAANQHEMRIDGEITAAGLFNGHYIETGTGRQQYGLRNAFSSSFTDTQRSRLARQLATGVFPGATGDSLEIFDGRDLNAVPRVAVAIHNGRAASASAGTSIVNLPIKDYASDDLIGSLQDHIPRKYPIDVADVVGPIVAISELNLTLPEGWHARLPPNVSATSAFGSYTAQYAQNGRVLHVTRRISGAKGTEPGDHVKALIAWLQSVSQDDVRFIVIDHPN